MLGSIPSALRNMILLICGDVLVVGFIECVGLFGLVGIVDDNLSEDHGVDEGVESQL